MWGKLAGNQLLMSRNKHKKSMCQIDGVFRFACLPPPQYPGAQCVIVCHQDHHEHTNHLPPVTVRHSKEQRSSWVSNQKTPGKNKCESAVRLGLKFHNYMHMQCSVDIDLELAWALFHYNQYQQFMLVLLSHSVWGREGGREGGVYGVIDSTDTKQVTLCKGGRGFWPEGTFIWQQWNKENQLR